MKKLACLVPLAVALAACGAPETPATTEAPSSVATAPADQPATPVPPQSAEQMGTAKLEKILAGHWRSDANKARDAYRHPRQTLEFFGIEPTQTVVEIAPGGGWYTEILAPLLKDSGHYIAAFANDASSDYAKKTNDKFRELLQKDAAEFGPIQQVAFDPKAPMLGAPDSADAVLTFRNVHNWVSSDSAPLMFQAFFDVLKPGGTLGVVEHRAAAGAGLDKKSGYLPQDYVIELATQAGFKLVAQSEINANPKDTKDYEKGVWTLPPNLALGEQDREKYLAIGESDRMTLKFEKPQGDHIFRQGADNSAADDTPATN